METDGKSSVQVETSQTYASRQTAFWRHVRGTRVTSCRPSCRWRPGRDVKLSWNMRDSSERQCQGKDGAGGKTRWVPPAHLDTHTYTHSASVLHEGRRYEPAVTALLNNIDDKSIPSDFPPLSLCFLINTNRYWKWHRRFHYGVKREMLCWYSYGTGVNPLSVAQETRLTGRNQVRGGNQRMSSHAPQ